MVVRYDVGVLAHVVRQAKQEAWLMEIRQELERLVEQSKHELQEAKEIIARQEQRIATLQRQLPKVLELLEVLGVPEDEGVEEIGAEIPERSRTIGQNPFNPSTYDYACWDILAASNAPMRARDVVHEVCRRLKKNVRRSTIQNVFYARNQDIFERVGPGLFQLAKRGGQEGDPLG